jgi:hypothetical protein
MKKHLSKRNLISHEKLRKIIRFKVNNLLKPMYVYIHCIVLFRMGYCYFYCFNLSTLHFIIYVPRPPFPLSVSPPSLLNLPSLSLPPTPPAPSRPSSRLFFSHLSFSSPLLEFLLLRLLLCLVTLLPFLFTSPPSPPPSAEKLYSVIAIPGPAAAAPAGP